MSLSRSVSRGFTLVATAWLAAGCGNTSGPAATSATSAPAATSATSAPGTVPPGTCTEVVFTPTTTRPSLQALDVVWSTTLPIGGDLAEYEYPSSGLATTGEFAYIGLSDGTLHAVDLATGVAGWSVDVSADAAPGDPQYGGVAGQFHLDPVVNDEVVYLGSNAGVVRAIDAASGSTRWSVSTGQVTGRPVVAGDRVIVGVQPWMIDEAAYIGLDSASMDPTGEPPPATLRAFAADGGAPLWQVVMPYESAIPVLAGDTLVVTSAVVDRVGSGGAVLGLDPRTGAERWRAEVGAGLIAPVVAGGSVFVLGNGVLVAFDPTNGQQRWRSTEPRVAGDPLESAAFRLAATGNVVAAVAMGNPYWLYAMDANSGKCLWKTPGGYESGYRVEAAGADLFVQETNCSPVQVDPGTGSPLGWIDPNGSPGAAGEVTTEYCWSLADVTLSLVSDLLIAAGSFTIMGIRPRS